MAIGGPSYPTLEQADEAATAVVSALIARSFRTDEEIQAAWIIVGYGLSLGFGTPQAKLLHAPKSAALGAFNWQQLVATLLQMLAGMLNPTTA